MCLIMTALAAAVFGVAFLLLKKRGKDAKAEFSVMMCFAAAALMWCVDGIASVVGGEGFFDLSRRDFVLGLIVVAAGCVLYGVLRLRGKKGAAENADA